MKSLFIHCLLLLAGRKLFNQALLILGALLFDPLALVPLVYVELIHLDLLETLSLQKVSHVVKGPLKI